MGDLIIKPASSGSLKIQDQAGTDFITTGTSSGLTIGSGVTFPAGGTGNPISIAILADQKPDGTQGGTFTTGAWRTRDLKTTAISDPDSIVSSIQSSTAGTQHGGGNMGHSFTLAAGTYLIEYSAPAFDTDAHQAKLYDITGSADLNFGTSEHSGSGDSTSTRSIGKFIHTITSANVYEIRHYAETTKASSGFGIAISNSNAQTYTMVTITKLK